MNFEKIDLKNYAFNPFSSLADNWALLSAGNLENHNAMTISWGGFGVLWHKLSAIVYVRSQRFTKQFIDNNHKFTINFFDEKYKTALQFYGTNSGKNINKEEKTGLNICEFDSVAGYSQARLVLVCKKQYVDQFKEDKFLNKNVINQFYPDKDFHWIYIAEIESAYLKK